MGNYSTYTLEELRRSPGGACDLADGLIWDIAAAVNFSLPDAFPSSDTLNRLREEVAPNKLLAFNDELQRRLGKGYLAVCTEWVLRSGILDLSVGPFTAPSPTGVIPDYVDTGVTNGGVGNWVFRRRNAGERLDPEEVGCVLLAMADRVMGEGEHRAVMTFRRRHGDEPTFRLRVTADGKPLFPTEAEFAKEFVLPDLRDIFGFAAEVFSADSADGDIVFQKLVKAYPGLLDGTVLFIGNQPNTGQAAAQFFLAAHAANEDFNANGDQFFIHGEPIPPALHGEKPATNQQIPTTVAQIIRVALNYQKILELTR